MKVHPRASWRSISGRSESSPWSSRQGHHPSTYARSQRDKRREVNGGRIIINKAEAATGARVRGATQHGATGNIWPGFDPAAAPCETDAKAGGQSSPPEPVHALPVSKYKDRKSFMASSQRQLAPPTATTSPTATRSIRQLAACGLRSAFQRPQRAAIGLLLDIVLRTRWWLR